MRYTDYLDELTGEGADPAPVYNYLALPNREPAIFRPDTGPTLWDATPVVRVILGQGQGREALQEAAA